MKPIVCVDLKGPGRRVDVDLREVLNTIFYLNRSGCQWDMLPDDLSAKSTSYEYFAKLRDNGTAASRLLELVDESELPRLEVIFADNKFNNRSLDAWMKENRPNWKIEIQSPPTGEKGFSPVRVRWVVERSKAWHGRCHRNSKDYKRRPDSSATVIEISHIGIMLRKCAPVQRNAFNYNANVIAA